MIIKERVMGIGDIIVPISLPIIRTGRKAATVVKQAAKTGGNILCAPILEASL